MAEIDKITTTLDDVQDNVDKLMLSIFESVRSHTSLVPLNSTTSDSNSNINSEIIHTNTTSIVQSYVQTLHTIDNLAGIHKTKNEQEIKLNQLYTEYYKKKNSVIELEKALIIKAEIVDNQLEELLSDESIGIN